VVMTSGRNRDLERRTLLRCQLRGLLADVEKERLDAINAVTAEWKAHNCSEGEILPALKRIGENSSDLVRKRKAVFQSWTTDEDIVFVKQSYNNCLHTMDWLREYGWKDIAGAGGELDGKVIGERSMGGLWNVVDIEGGTLPDIRSWLNTLVRDIVTRKVLFVHICSFNQRIDYCFRLVT
jgi:hypothetical protein